MALMNNIIKKYQAEANQRISDARKPNSENTKAKKDLLDSIIINKGCGKNIEPTDPDAAKKSFKKAVSNSVIREEVKHYNTSGKKENLDPSAAKPKSNVEDTVIMSPGQQSNPNSSGDVFKELDKLKVENRKLKEEIERLKKG